MRRLQLGAVPSTLTVDGRAVRTAAEFASLGIRRRDLAGAGRRQVAEDVGEIAVGDRVAQSVVEDPGLVGHDAVDDGDDRAVAHGSGHGWHGRRGQRPGHHPRHEEQGHHGDEDASDVVGPPAPFALYRVPKFRSGPRRRRLADERQPEDHREGEEDPSGRTVDS